MPSLRAVYVGLSAGSMVMAPSLGEDFVGWTPPTGGDKTLGLVDFAIFPHLDRDLTVGSGSSAFPIKNGGADEPGAFGGIFVSRFSA